MRSRAAITEAGALSMGGSPGTLRYTYPGYIYYAYLKRDR